MNRKSFLLIVVLLSGFTAFGQSNQNKDTATVNKLLAESKGFIGSDSAKAVNLALQAKEMAIKLKFPKGEAYALKNIGMVYYQRGMFLQTLDYWNQSLQIFEQVKDNVGTANMLSNIGAIYLTQGADAKALEYSLRSLQMGEKIGDTVRMITTLANIGGIYYNKKDLKALDYLLRAMPLFKNFDRIKYLASKGEKNSRTCRICTLG